MVKNNGFILSLLISVILSVCFGNISIAICGIVYAVIILQTSMRFSFCDRKLLNHIFLVWMLQILFTVLVYFIMIATYGVPYAMDGLDDYMVDVEWSDKCLNNGLYSIHDLKNTSEFRYFNNKGFLVLVVWMKILFRPLGGYHTLDIRLFNMMIWLVTSIIMGGYANEYLSARKEDVKKIITLIALLPNALFISSLVYRDTIVAFFIVLTFYLWSDFSKKPISTKIGIIFITLIVVYLTYYYRIQAVLYVGASIVVGFANKKASNNFFLRIYNKKIIAYMAIMGFILLMGGDILANFHRFLSTYDEMKLNSTGIQAMISRIPLLPFGWILRTLFYMLLPFYYRDIIPITALDDPISLLRCFVSLGTVFLLFLYPYVLLYCKKMNNIVIVYLFMIISIAVVTSGFRHVILTYPMLIAMGVMGKKYYEYRKT